MAEQRTFESGLPQMLAGLFGTKSGGTSTKTDTSDVSGLKAVQDRAMMPMDSKMYGDLIASIFQSAAGRVPELTAALANATGSRSSNNSPLALALNEQNNQAATAAATQILGYNQKNLEIAGNAASGVSRGTSSSKVTESKAVGKPGVNPLLMSLLGFAGNKLDKSGALDRLFSRGAPQVGSTNISPINQFDMGNASSGIFPGAGFTPMNSPDFSGGGVDFGSAGGFDMFGGLGGSSFSSSAPDFSSSFSAPDFGSDMPDFGGFDLVNDSGGFDLGFDAAGFNLDFEEVIPTLFNAIPFADGGPMKRNYATSKIDAREQATVNNVDPAQALRDMLGANANQLQTPLLELLLHALVPGMNYGGKTPAQGSVTPGRVGPGVEDLMKQRQLGYADGGMVRNRNNMGARQRLDTTDAINGGASGGGGSGLSSQVLTNMLTQRKAKFDQITPNMDVEGGSGSGDESTMSTEQEGLMAKDAATGYKNRDAMLIGLALSALGPVASTMAQSAVPMQAIQLAQMSGLAPKNQMNPMAVGIKALASLFGGGATTQAGPPEGSIATVDPVSGGMSSSMPATDVLGNTAPGNMSMAPDMSLDFSQAGLDATGGVAPGGGEAPTPGAVGVPFSDGGPIEGPGTGTSDSIPATSKTPGGGTALFSDGEFLIPASVVRRLGQPFFQGLIDAFHTPVRR